MTWNKDGVIETYLSCLEERFEIPSKRLNNLTKDGHKSLSKESLFSEISVLSKRLKFALIKKTLIKLKRELEEYCRDLWLMWHFRNREKPFYQERYKPKSTFNHRNKDAVIETYLSCLEERTEIPSKRFNNLSQGGHKSL